MSTDPGFPGPPAGAAPSAAAAVFDATRAYEKHPQVAVRAEEFGGLAYHYGNRRLVFLKAPELVRLVESLAGFACARDALAVCVPAPRRAACETALASLLAADVIRPAVR